MYQLLDMSLQDEQFMARAIELAQMAAINDEVPVGAVLVENGSIIGEGSNTPISSGDVTSHAELIALRQGCATKQNYRLPNTTLYVTLEPCAMCAGALVHARVSRVVVAAREPRAGAAGSVLNVLNNEKLNHRCDVSFGLMEKASASLLKDFFKQKRLISKKSKTDFQIK